MIKISEVAHFAKLVNPAHLSMLMRCQLSFQSDGQSVSKMSTTLSIPFVFHNFRLCARGGTNCTISPVRGGREWSSRFLMSSSLKFWRLRFPCDRPCSSFILLDCVILGWRRRKRERKRRRRRHRLVDAVEAKKLKCHISKSYTFFQSFFDLKFKLSDRIRRTLVNNALSLSTDQLWLQQNSSKLYARFPKFLENNYFYWKLIYILWIIDGWKLVFEPSSISKT